MATTDTTATEAKDAVTEGTLLLFELENVAFPGRKKLYDLCKKNVAALGVQLTPGLFSRLAIKPTPELAVASLAEGAGNGKGDAEKIGDDVNAAYVAELRGKSEANAHIVKLLTAAAKKGFHLGALSSLDQESAEALLGRLDVSSVKLHAHKPDEPTHPRADGWLKLARAITRANLPAVAVVSSQIACKAALAAGFRVIVVPDEFTSFQDFGGADIIVDSAADLDVGEIIATLKSN